MRRLKHRRAPLLATLVAVALGAALVSGCAGLFETALRLDAPPERLAGATLVVAGPEHATLAAGAGKPAQEVTLSERATLPGGVRDHVASIPGVASATYQPGLGAVAVTAERGTAPAELATRVRRALRGERATVLTGNDRGRAEQTGVAASRLDLILLAAVSGGMALIVMAILLASIIGLAVDQRRRELGLLRTIGATPKQVRKMVLAQTMRPAVPSAIAGALAGPVLGRALFDLVRDGGVVPGVLELHQGVICIAAGALTALLGVRISAGIAARRAAKAELGDSLAEVDADPGRVGIVRRGLAGVMVAAALSCAFLTMFMPPENAAAVGGGTALAGAIACALLAPLITEYLGARLRGITERLGGLPGELAVTNVRARPVRTGALVTPVVLVAAIALANVYQQTTQADAMRDAYLENLRADAVVTSDSGAIGPAAIAAARRAGDVSPLVTSKGWIEDPVDKAHRIDPRPLLGIAESGLATKISAGSASRLRGDSVALPADTAGDLGLDLGDRVGIVLGDGAHVRLRVVALLEASSRYASIVLPAALLAAHVTDQELEQLMVNGGDGVHDRLKAAVAGQPGVHVQGAGALADGFDGDLRVDMLITFAVVGVILAYAALSLVNSLVAALAGRRAELGLLRMAGATRRQLRRMLTAEALVVAAIGAIAGTVVAAVGLVPLAMATAGSPLPSGPVWVFPAVLCVIAALVLIPTQVAFAMTSKRQEVLDADAA